MARLHRGTNEEFRKAECGTSRERRGGERARRVMRKGHCSPRHCSNVTHEHRGARVSSFHVVFMTLDASLNGRCGATHASQTRGSNR